MQHTPIDHKAMIHEYVKELVRLTIERDEIERKMGKRHLAIRGLLNLLDSNAERQAYEELLDICKVRMGISDAILQCLALSEKPKTPTEIRDFIVNYGIEASTQQNLLQAIHVSLTRLEKTGNVKRQRNADGEKAFKLLTYQEKLQRFGWKKDETDSFMKEIMKFQPNPALAGLGMPAKVERDKRD